MRRRTFSKWIWSGFISLFLPRWARAQAVGLSEADVPMLNEVAAAVLPSSSSGLHATETAAHFREWIRNYHTDADAGYGYGHPQPRSVGPNPSAHYSDQLRELRAAAKAKGSDFGKLSETDKQTLIQAALTTAGVKTLPPRPTGQHVASDLMSFFYNSSAGEDFLYNAAIRREDCRGLANSGKRPVALS